MGAPQRTTVSKGAIMERQYRSKFVDGTGQVFLVDEVCQKNGNLTVFYQKEATGQKYSCLLEAFSERFREIEND
jgi:hypothetical protein